MVMLVSLMHVSANTIIVTNVSGCQILFLQGNHLHMNAINYIIFVDSIRHLVNCSSNHVCVSKLLGLLHSVVLASVLLQVRHQSQVEATSMFIFQFLWFSSIEVFRNYIVNSIIKVNI